MVLSFLCSSIVQLLLHDSEPGHLISAFLTLKKVTDSVFISNTLVMLCRETMKLQLSIPDQ